MRAWIVMQLTSPVHEDNNCDGYGTMCSKKYWGGANDWNALVTQWCSNRHYIEDDAHRRTHDVITSCGHDAHPIYTPRFLFGRSWGPNGEDIINWICSVSNGLARARGDALGAENQSSHMCFWRFFIC